MWALAKSSFPLPLDGKSPECKTLLRLSNASTADLRGDGDAWGAVAVSSDLQQVHILVRDHVLKCPIHPLCAAAPPTTNFPRTPLHCSTVVSHTGSEATRRQGGATCGAPTIAFLIEDEAAGDVATRRFLCVLSPNFAEEGGAERGGHSHPRRWRHARARARVGSLAWGEQLSYTKHAFPVSKAASIVAVSPLGDCVFVLPSAISSSSTGAVISTLALAASPTPVLTTSTLTWGTSKTLRRRVKGLRRPALRVVDAFCRHTPHGSADVELVVQTERGQFVGFVAAESAWVCSGVCSLAALGSQDSDQRDETTSTAHPPTQANSEEDNDDGRERRHRRPPQCRLAEAEACVAMSVCGSLSDANALDCAPAWRFTSRWLHTPVFLRAIAETRRDEELRNVFATTSASTAAAATLLPGAAPPFLSTHHTSKTLRRYARRGVEVLARCGTNQNIALLCLGAAGDEDHLYAISLLPSFTPSDDGGCGHETIQRHAPCVIVCFPSSVVNSSTVKVVSAAPVCSSDAVGFVVLLLLTAGKGNGPFTARTCSGRGGSASSASTVQLAFIPFSGVATALVPCPEELSPRDSIVGPRALESFAGRLPSAGMVAIVGKAQNDLLPCEVCTILVDRPQSRGKDDDESVPLRMAMRVSLPPATSIIAELFAFLSHQGGIAAALQGLRTRVTSITAFSLAACLPIASSPSDISSSPGGNELTEELAEFAIESFECVEGHVMLPEQEGPRARSLPDTQAAAAAVQLASNNPSLAVLDALLSHVFDGGATPCSCPLLAIRGLAANSVVQMFKGISQALHGLRVSDSVHIGAAAVTASTTVVGSSALALLQSVLASLHEAATHLIRQGNVTALLAALSFLVPTPHSLRRAAAHPALLANQCKLQAMVQPLFDASFPCVVSAFPPLIEDLTPLCSPETRHAVEAARALLLVQHGTPTLRHGEGLLSYGPDEEPSASTLVSLVLAHVQRGVDGLHQLQQRDVAFTATRLFLENGAQAAVDFLDPFVSAPACSEGMRVLHRFYRDTHARTARLRGC